MRLVQAKIFNVNRCYYVIVERIKLTDKSKILEFEYTKKLDNKNEVQYYLTNILNTKELRKNKIFINYISNDVLIETINQNKENKEDFHKQLNNLYPNYKQDYELLTGEIKYNSKNKKKVCALVKNEVISEIKTLLSLVGKKRVYYGVDSLLLQQLINKNSAMFNKKYLVLIQKNFNYYRFYQILNGKIINYIVLDSESNDFNNIYQSIIKLIDSKVDEVIVDAEYNVYIELVDKLFNVNVVLIDYIERISHIDERKIAYGKKTI